MKREIPHANYNEIGRGEITVLRGTRDGKYRIQNEMRQGDEMGLFGRRVQRK